METIWRFCPQCAGSLELRLLKRGDPQRHVCRECNHVIYQDPKVAVGTIIAADDRPVDSAADLSAVIADRDPGDELDLEVIDTAGPRLVTVAVAKRAPGALP